MVICKPSIGVTLLLPLVSLNKPTIDEFLVYNSFCIKIYIQQRTLLIRMQSPFIIQLIEIDKIKKHHITVML